MGDDNLELAISIRYAETRSFDNTFPMPALIDENDARGMVRLVAAVTALQADHTTAKRSLMNGLKEMIGADCWVWALGYLNPDKPPVYASFLHDGFDEMRFARYLQAVEHPQMKTLMEPFTRELMTRKSQLTRTREQIDSAGGNVAAAAVDSFWLAADIAPIILSARQLTDECVSIIALYRPAAEPMFDERERMISHILLTEVPWLHTAGWPEDFGAKTPMLSRQRRLVLNLLLEGGSRKIIADQLGLSIHTVSDYVKDIYRTFGVQSHAELMRRFTKGDSQTQ